MAFRIAARGASWIVGTGKDQLNAKEIAFLQYFCSEGCDYLRIMSSTISQSRLADEHTEESLDEVNLMGVAADLLQQLFAELGSIATHSPQFALAMSLYAPDVRAQLSTLHTIADVLTHGDDPFSTGQLKHRAAVLISCLAEKADQLTRYAVGVGDPDGCGGAINASAARDGESITIEAAAN